MRAAIESGFVEELPRPKDKRAKPTAQNQVPNVFEEIKSARDLMSTPARPVLYCVPNRVPCGLVLVAARPKFKKSWFALQLAVARSTGGQFMGVPTPACRALMIVLEDNPRRMRHRLEFFGLTPESAPEALHIAYEWPAGLEGAETIELWLAKYPDTKLVVIDVLQRMRGSRDRNVSAYESDYQTMALLHGITQRHDGLTIVVVHHTKKGAVDDPIEAISGTFGLTGATDAFIILRRGTEAEQVIAHIDGRDWESFEHEFLWEFRPEDGWVQIGVSEAEVLTATQNEIVLLARNDGFVTPTSLASWRKVSRPTAHEALRALVAKGALRVSGGKYYPIGGVR